MNSNYERLEEDTPTPSRPGAYDPHVPAPAAAPVAAAAASPSAMAAPDRQQIPTAAAAPAGAVPTAMAVPAGAHHNASDHRVFVAMCSTRVHLPSVPHKTCPARSSRGTPSECRALAKGSAANGGSAPPTPWYPEPGGKECPALGVVDVQERGALRG